MPQRDVAKPPDYVYPPEEWRLVETRFYERLLPQAESFFALSNGYFGMRGGFEEGDPCHEAGTFVNGFYESWPIVYGEEAHGFAKTGQTIVNLPDPKIIRIYVDDERLHLPRANLLHFERALDMRRGTLDRELLWETPAGKRVSIRSRRLVSLRHRHVAAIEYEVVLPDDCAPVVISSELVQHVSADKDESDPRRRALNHGVLEPLVAQAEDLRVILGFRTRNSGMLLGCGIDHTIETSGAVASEVRQDGESGQVVFSFEATPGARIRLTKFISFHNSKRVTAEELCERAGRTLSRVRAQGFEALAAEQREDLDDFWQRSDVQLEGEESPERERSFAYIQQAIRFNLFGLLQASARTDGLGIPAKGLTGQGYEGHYFWDTEIYVLPFLVYTMPRVARNVLALRHRGLDLARERAREVNQKGALFPWRTISGEEASAYYAAGTAQYHINADIVYALRKYVLATGDEEFLFDQGAEILVETARMWRDLGFFCGLVEGRFSITGVTGPDEYNTVVNNNLYTNLMARENLWYAAQTVERLQADHPERLAQLVDRTGLEVEEVEEWRRAADGMYLPYDEKRGIYLQDSDFMERRPMKLEDVPPDKFPLLLHFHPLVIYRHQVIKQADVVLAMFLLGDEFSLEEKRRVFDFYDPLTTGDSSLSACIQSIVAIEVGDFDKAIDYMRSALLVDLENTHGNVKDGLHIASMGGTWMALVYGMAGFRDHDGHFSFDPVALAGLTRLRFPLTLEGQRLRVEVASGQVEFTLEEGEDLRIECRGRELHLTSEQPRATVPLPPA
ncbi:MAG: glycoside hydrolase family 65 protein [Deltaproteobacteria bacterium]|nr:glycoside hydrolase family 65 protein [Deltaproteobacteria bacterium]MBW2418110.1 glycoside hydrolase family 65 protein [Deltaproteobacteria bacterium]